MSRLARADAQHVAFTELSPTVHKYACRPYSTNAEIAHRYHLGNYRTWCADSNRQMFPVDVPQLLAFGADRARKYSFSNVNADIRVVCFEHRKATGIDLYSHTRVAHFLKALRRISPPQPVLPLKPSEFEQIIAFHGGTWKTRRTRVMAMLCWAAGFTTRELQMLDAEMIRFDNRGALVTFGPGIHRRESVIIGRAHDASRCPVAALEELMASREILQGPVFHRTPRLKPRTTYRLSYQAISASLRILAEHANVNLPFSVERIRRGGLIVQAQQIDIVTLAHYHGMRSIENLSRYLGGHVEIRRNFGRRSR